MLRIESLYKLGIKMLLIDFWKSVRICNNAHFWFSKVYRCIHNGLDKLSVVLGCKSTSSSCVSAGMDACVSGSAMPSRKCSLLMAFAVVQEKQRTLKVAGLRL